MIKEVDSDGWTTLVRKPRIKKPKTQVKQANQNTQPTFMHKKPRIQTTNMKKPLTQPKVKEDIVDSEQPLQLRTIGIEVGQAIQKARLTAAMSQKDLATRLNEKLNTISSYENGNGLYNNTVLEKLEHVLGIKLRGKGIGTSLQPKKQ